MENENLNKEQNIKMTNERNYDKEPLTITDNSILFSWSWLLFLWFVCLVWLCYVIFTAQNSERFWQQVKAILCGLYCIFSTIKQIKEMMQKEQQNKSYFAFTNQSITSTRDYIISDLFSKNKYINENKTIPNPALNLEKVYFCVVCELGENYGRFHYFTPYELYKKSSIGVHIGKIVLYIMHLALYLLFALPYKIYKLKKTNEPLWLLKKNFVIRCKNRNYLLVNVYSVKEHNELLEYFKSINIEVENKTKFIPHIQNDGWFQDKNEIWSDDFSDTEIPKDTFKKKVRRFFSLD